MNRAKNHDMCPKPENTEAGKTHNAGKKSRACFFKNEVSSPPTKKVVRSSPHQQVGRETFTWREHEQRQGYKTGSNDSNSQHLLTVTVCQVLCLYPLISS